jgi:hypothetical protein
MTRHLRRARHRGAAMLAVGLGAGILIGAGTASADSAVPYKDIRVKGTLTLCDASGHTVTSGNINDRPTFAYVVSSEAPPQGYAAKTTKATVYAYQPRPQVDPGEWSGQQLSGSSIFSNLKHPMVEVTTGDKTMGEFIGAFPPKVDGLIQLRVYLTAPNKQAYQLTYPAVNLRISGSTFVVVDGGTTPCTVGQAISNERINLPPSAFPTPTAGTPRPSTGTGATSGPTTSTASPNSSQSVVAAAEDPVAQTTDSGSNTVVLGLLLVLLVGLAVVGFVIVRNRLATRRGSP